MRNSNAAKQAVENEPDPDPEITLKQKVVDLNSTIIYDTLSEWGQDFVRSIGRTIANPNRTLSAKQRGWVFRLWKQYVKET